MHQNTGYFRIPSSFVSGDIKVGNEKVVVVSIFGHSSVDFNGYKISLFEKLFGKNIFNRRSTQIIQLNEAFSGIEGYYNPDQQIIFLHLAGALDCAALHNMFATLDEELQEKGFLVVWSDLKLQYARKLLLLFTVSHLLLLFQPNHVFDVSYIHLFRTLDSVRVQFQECASDILRKVSGVSGDWQFNGRLSSPRVLFVFSSCLIPSHILNDASSGNKSQNKGTAPNSPLRKLELNLEYQIYRLLRKSRVITNISANSLFALPNNQPFVYVLEESLDDAHPSTLIDLSLSRLCGGSFVDAKAGLASADQGVGCDSFQPISADGSRREFVNALSDWTGADSLSGSILSAVCNEKRRNVDHSFNVFIRLHIEEALSRGFMDSVGRHATLHFFEVPPANVWFEAFHKLYKFYAGEHLPNSPEDEMIESLRNGMQTEVRYSDARCSKVLPLAVSTYSEGLPTHYTKARHQTKLAIAMSVLSAEARGPMFESYVKQLEETCEAIWKDGREGCETLSLTGKNCIQPQHLEHSEPDSDLPVMGHTSNVAYVSYCNCGCHEGQMEDPFGVRSANYDFFAKLASAACSVADVYPFPTFSAGVEHAKAAKIGTDSGATWDHDPEAGGEQRPTQAGSDSSPGLSMLSPGLGQGGHGRSQDDSNVEEPEIIVSVEERGEQGQSGDQDNKKTSESNAEFIGSITHRQASTSEYLPGMLTTASPPGLLPKVQSWSLVCLGPSSLYSHNTGICEQPGFLNGTNFLLPWDVNIKIKDKDKWPAITDSMGKKGIMLRNRKSKFGVDISEFSVKIFLGTEYQCVRGHRFMMSSPDRPLKASPVGHVKETAVRIANSDMPLYFPCPCSRRGSFSLGQLMRIHLITPKAPVHVTLQPQVQPCPDASQRFIPQPPSFPTIKLSASAYWVLRLPFAYVGESGPIYPPKPYRDDVTSYGKLLKGCYGISEITLDG